MSVNLLMFSRVLVCPSSCCFYLLQVPVKFCPKTKGTFNQHWEVEYQTLATHKVAAQDKITTKISLTAEVTQLAFHSQSRKRKKTKISVTTKVIMCLTKPNRPRALYNKNENKYIKTET